MNIQINIDKPKELTTFVLKGELDFNEFLASIVAHHEQSPHTMWCLWDFRAVTGGERVSVMQMGQFYGLCKQYFYGETAHKIAFVVNEKMGFGFKRTMVMFEETYDVYLNVRVFKNMQDAIEWIEERSE